MENNFNETTRYEAGKTQMIQFGTSQFIFWRLTVVKSIKKILLNMSNFYSDLEIEIIPEKELEQYDIVNNQIKNGWLFEIVAQAVQNIEELFALLKNSKDLSNFVKNFVNYKASDTKKYIWNFQSDDIDYILKEFGIPSYLLSLEEDKESFQKYSRSIRIIQDYVKAIQAFHKKYYRDYCQYKHGMAVALTPYGKFFKKNDSEFKKYVRANLLQGSLNTFDNEVLRGRSNSSNLPAIMIALTDKTQPHISNLHSEKNLLHRAVSHVNVDDVVKIVEQTTSLLSIVWQNLFNKSEGKSEFALPTENLFTWLIVKFPPLCEDNLTENIQ